jgi:O-antigen/teichoic acid export membrane protein
LTRDSSVSVADTSSVVVGANGVAALSGTALSGPWAEAGRRSAGRTAVAIRGSAWTIAEYVATQGLRTLATLVLARYFLSPETFGVVGLATVFISGLTMFSELGIVVNIVQHPRGDDPEFLNTAFSLQAARGLLIWAAAAAAAYPLALFYKQPELFLLLVAAAAGEAIRGFTSTSAWTLKRHLKLRNIALLGIGSEAVAFVVAILWALASPTAWVLVGRALASAVVFALGSHFIIAHRVSFRWDRSAGNAILKFGGWISISTAAYFLAGQGERLILGKFVTPIELGCFSLALVIASVPGTGIGQLLNQIFLPMISNSVRTSPADTLRDFVGARKIFFAIGLLAALGFLALGQPFVALLLRPEYHMAGWMLQILGLRVAMDLFAAPASSLILAHGQSRYTAAGNVTRLVFMLSGIWMAFAYFGIKVAVVSLIIAQALSYFPLIVGLRRLVPEAGRAELRWYTVFLCLLGLATMVPWPAHA